MIRSHAHRFGRPLVGLRSRGACAHTAMAQDQAAVDKLVQMNKKALDDYDTLDWDAAKRILLDALVAGKKAGLDNHPVMGRTYIHLGAVYITGLQGPTKGAAELPARAGDRPDDPAVEGDRDRGGHGHLRRGAAQRAQRRRSSGQQRRRRR